MSDEEIGRVISVDTAEVTIELNKDLKAMTRSTYEENVEVGRINSYIIIPVGTQRLVGMVTKVVLAEEAEVNPKKTMVSLPSAKRIMKATLIGTITKNTFEQGVNLFPVLDSPVYLVAKDDLELIFESDQEGSSENGNSGFNIHIGKSPIFQNKPIYINPDEFFGKHAAVIGSTGAGKSCTIASVIQSVLDNNNVNRTNFVILDTNGEYRTAFQKQNEEDDWEDVENRDCLYIPSDPNRPDEKIKIPYWFMDSEDFSSLFRASEGVQKPVLLEALRMARNRSSETNFRNILLEEIKENLYEIFSFADSKEKKSMEVRRFCDGLREFVKDENFEQAWERIDKFDKQKFIEDLDKVEEISEESIGKNEKEGYEWSKKFPPDAKKKIKDLLNPYYKELVTSSDNQREQTPPDKLSADQPAYFDKNSFREEYLERVLDKKESSSSGARQHAGTMLMRIDRLFADSRFDFLFGPEDETFPSVDNSLATFLRDLIGLTSPDGQTSEHPDSDYTKGELPFYDRQKEGSEGNNVVVLDLSLLASEVLENVTALIGRLLLEFLQRLGEIQGNWRGELPVALILEEAQNYIPESSPEGEEPISKKVFERIAREGRKYGLGLVVASQRPSELSKTVLSQCNNFVTHRLQNPEDLRYIKRIVPGIYQQLVEQLPALAQQHALVLGECVKAPALVRIKDSRPIPRSKDPKFYNYWTKADYSAIPVEEVCKYWKGESPKQDNKKDH